MAKISITEIVKQDAFEPPTVITPGQLSQITQKSGIGGAGLPRLANKFAQSLAF
jgi:hypothetical protein